MDYATIFSLLSNSSIQYCDSNIGLFSFAFFKVIALPTIVTAIVGALAVAIVGRAITVWEAIQKRSHEPIYKNLYKKWSKGIKSDNFAIAKLEER